MSDFLLSRSLQGPQREDWRVIVTVWESTVDFLAHLLRALRSV